MTVWEIAAYALAAVLALALCRIFFKPLRRIAVFALSSGLGGVGLYLVNLIGSPFQFTLGVNVVTASVCGLLGAPGLAMLIALKAIYCL